MKITVIEYSGKVHHIECEGFEFRTNQVANWIKIKYQDRSQTIKNVAVIKTDNGEYIFAPTTIEADKEYKENESV